MTLSVTPTRSSPAVAGKPISLPVWPLRSNRDYERARRVVDNLIVRSDLSSAERATMDVFLDLMEAYEARHEQIRARKFTPIQLLKSLMQDHEMSASDLGRLLGNRALGPAILTGGRELSKAHIRKLAAHFAIEPGAFI